MSVEEFRLDPTRPATELDRIVRGGNPRPGAWMPIGGKRIKVWRAHPARSGPPGEPGLVTPAAELVTADGVLVLDEVQPEGKRPMPGAGVARRRARRDARRPA